MHHLLFLFFILSLLISCSAPPAPIEANPQKAPVVLVHGLFSKGYWLRDLEQQCASLNYPTLRPTLKPADGTVKIEILARQLQEHIENKFGPTQRIHLVAHSMGGLISRYYLEELGGSHRALSLQTIATPHHGAPLSRLHPGAGGIQMRPGSQFLTRLNAGPSSPYPEISYYTKADLIVPWRSSIRPHAKNVELPPAVHQTLPKHSQVIQGVIREITKAQTPNSRFPLSTRKVN